MTSPIRSRSECNETFDSESYERAITCREPPKSTSSVGPGEDAACHLPNDAGETRESPATTHESATSGRSSHDPIATFVATSEVDGPTVGAEVFAIQGRDERTGIEVEVFSAAARTSVMQDGGQVGMARLGWSRDDGHFAVRSEVMTAKFHSGTENPDGTTGLNLGAGFTSVSAEIKGTYGPISAAIGVSGGVTVSGSIGVGDLDADGLPEACARVETPFWTAGGCVEKFW
jgi:hypothetical protein